MEEKTKKTYETPVAEIVLNDDDDIIMVSIVDSGDYVEPKW